MPCLDAVCQLAGRRIAQCLGHALVVLLCVLLLCLGGPSARAQGVEVLELKASRDEVSVSLEYQLRVTLPPAVEAAVERGVPLYFSAQASLLRPRWYWRDERTARVSREWRLSFQPLTSTWRVSQGGLGQSFANLAEALSAMTRSTGWRIADARDVEPDGRHYIEFSWRLDTSQLPRPMQIGLGGVGGTSEWSLGVERSFRLISETPK
jgi:Domain of unknown function (DUF4390)